MHHRLYVHVVWTTRGRARLINAATERFLREFLPKVARQEHADTLAIGMVRTHVHILLRISPLTSIPRLLQRLKGGSSTLAKREVMESAPELRWARSYSISSVGERALPAARNYVLNQPMHHPEDRIVD